MLRRLPVPLLLAAALAAGCGDDEPTAEEIRTTTIEREPLEAPPVTSETLPSPGTGTTTTAPDPTPEGTGGATPAPTPPAASPAPAPSPPPATTPRGTGGVTPGGDDQEGGAGDEDPTASPGGTPAP